MSDDSPHFTLEYHELLKVFEVNLFLARECFLDDEFEVRVEAPYRQVGIANGRLEIRRREVTLSLLVEKVERLPQILRAD